MVKQMTNSLFKELVANLRDTFIRAVPRFEIEHRCPVVRKVFTKSAASAGRHSWKVILYIHGSIEGILAFDLSFVYMAIFL